MSKTSVILLFANWCGACSNFKKGKWKSIVEWGKVNDVKTEEIEESEFKDVKDGDKKSILDIKRFNMDTITAFPTIVIQKNGEMHIVIGGDHEKIMTILTGKTVQSGGGKTRKIVTCKARHMSKVSVAKGQKRKKTTKRSSRKRTSKKIKRISKRR